MELVEYILGDFWHFLGFLAILYIFFDGIIGIIKAFKKQ